MSPKNERYCCLKDDRMPVRNSVWEITDWDIEPVKEKVKRCVNQSWGWISTGFPFWDKGCGDFHRFACLRDRVRKSCPWRHWNAMEWGLRKPELVVFLLHTKQFW